MEKNKYGKALRSELAKLVSEKGITEKDLETFRRVGEVMALAKQRVADERGCTVAHNTCSVGADCGYTEGGCGTNESCSACNSCMVVWNTCGSGMTT